jgi:hypothetical protein
VASPWAHEIHSAWFVFIHANYPPSVLSDEYQTGLRDIIEDSRSWEDEKQTSMYRSTSCGHSSYRAQGNSVHSRTRTMTPTPGSIDPRRVPALITRIPEVAEGDESQQVTLMMRRQEIQSLLPEQQILPGVMTVPRQPIPARRTQTFLPELLILELQTLSDATIGPQTPIGQPQTGPVTLDQSPGLGQTAHLLTRGTEPAPHRRIRYVKAGYPYRDWIRPCPE